MSSQFHQSNVRSEPAVQSVNWQDFRDHLATADKEGRRQWLYPRKPGGKFYRRRTWLSLWLLVVMFAGPFVRIHGNPLLLLNFVERKFIILGHIFWPQDMIISAVTLLIFIVGIIIFTAAFGRLWCGWTCPQTVLMEMVFRKIEYVIEGDSTAQRALARAPWTTSKAAKKITKHFIFFSLSLIVGNTLLAYFIGTDQLFSIIRDNPARHLEGLTFMILFTFLFYGIFARFREQACTFICPYGRLQSTLLDENSIVVAYDYKRGEKRAPLRRSKLSESAFRLSPVSTPCAPVEERAGERTPIASHNEFVFPQRSNSGLGDCIDCAKCVNVCPTGIDIRNGTQMECVHCTACIDACDSVMAKIGRPLGLIRYASLNGIERGERLRFTARLGIYGAVLVALIALWGVLVFTRSDVDATLLRAPGSLFQQMPDGKFSNLYTIKIINKTSRSIPIELRLENRNGALQVMGGDIVVPPEKLSENSVLIELPKTQMLSGKTPVIVGVYADGKRIETLKTSFIGPHTND